MLNSSFFTLRALALAPAPYNRSHSAAVLLQLTVQGAQRGVQQWRLPGARPEEQLAARHLQKTEHAMEAERTAEPKTSPIFGSVFCHLLEKAHGGFV